MTGVTRTVASLAGIANRGSQAAALDAPVKIGVDRLNFYYGEKRALDGISIEMRSNLVTAFIGPSGCGKSTFLRTLNRMNDIIPATRVEGTVLIDGQSIYVGGRFNRVDGAIQQKVARLRVSDGTAMPFQATVDAVVTAMALQGDNLYIGGVFTRVQGQTRRFAALNKDTGVLNPNMTIDVAGTHRGTG